MADASPPKSDRNLAIDAVKGIGILQVVVHHTLGQSARTYAQKGDATWTTMRAVAWATNFAIPLFLLLSAVLLAGSFIKQPNVGRFVWRRTSRTLWPYLVWSVVYWLLRWRNDPHTFDNLRKLAGELLTGKAGYHLYFMVILIQLSIALPLVVMALRGRKIGFGTVLGLSVLLQIGFFLLNRVPAFNLKAPGSSLTWYVGPLLLGAWIALNRDAWAEAWSRWWPAFTLAAIAASVAFAYLNVQSELGVSPNSLLYNLISVVFRVGASLALLGAAATLAATSAGPLLAALGRYSLPIYLVHPAILRLLGGPRLSPLIGQVPIPALWVVILVTASSYGFAWLIGFVRLDPFFFGQTLPRRAPASA